MVAVDNVRCSGNINVVMLEREVGQKADKEGEMTGDEAGQVGTGLIDLILFNMFVSPFISYLFPPI